MVHQDANNTTPNTDTSIPQDDGSTNSEELWCYCQKPEDDRPMTGCDYPDCPIKWYHLDCSQLKEVPKGDWYCPDCRKKFSGRCPRGSKNL